MGRRVRDVWRVLALAAAPTLAVLAVIAVAPRHPPQAAVLHIRLAAWCYAGVTSTPSPCPIETWIDEGSGAVRERQVVLSTTMDQVFVPEHHGWRSADRIYTSGRKPNAAWSAAAWSSLPLPYPRSLADLRAATRRLLRAASGAQRVIVRGRAALAVTMPASTMGLPWPMATADIVDIDRATALPLRIVYLRGLSTNVFVDETTTARLPAGFLELPGGAGGTLLDSLLTFVGRLRPHGAH